MKRILIVLFSVFFSLSAFGQTADFLSKMIAEKKATYGEVCYLSAVQQELVADDATYTDAIKALYDNHQIPYEMDEAETVNLSNTAFIFSHMWPMQGGLMFRITHGSPRYVFRQMKSDGVIGSDADPMKKMSGTDVLNLFTLCQQKYDKQGAKK